jgi:hypothetical protein
VPQSPAAVVLVLVDHTTIQSHNQINLDRHETSVVFQPLYEFRCLGCEVTTPY